MFKSESDEIFLPHIVILNYHTDYQKHIEIQKTSAESLGISRDL